MVDTTDATIAGLKAAAPPEGPAMPDHRHIIAILRGITPAETVAGLRGAGRPPASP